MRGRDPVVEILRLACWAGQSERRIRGRKVLVEDCNRMPNRAGCYDATV